MTDGKTSTDYAHQSGVRAEQDEGCTAWVGSCLSSTPVIDWKGLGGQPGNCSQRRP